MSTKRRVRWLNAEEEAAWRAFRRLVVGVETAAAQDLAEHGLSSPDYEVMSTLSERPGASSTLHAQATKMGWSRSRLSRHATRMENRGLLTRAPDPADGRGCLIALSDDGRRVLEAVAPHHLDSVRRHFIDRLTREDLGHLVRISEAVVGPADG